MGHIFNSADLWEDMWAEMSETQKQEICTVNAEELHDKLWQHCTDKHHLCKDCRNNVMWAYDKLTKKEGTPVGTEAEQELASLQAYFDVDESKEGCICVHTTALPTILYHYEDTLAEESENNTKGRHAPTRQAGLSEMLCVVGRLLLRKVLTSYQSSLEEEQNQQLLVRLVLSHFQAQALERQALHNMASLLEEDFTPNKGGASKRKLKKDRRAKRQELADEAQSECVTWDEDQELLLLKRMSWGICVGAPSYATGSSSASRSDERQSNGSNDGASGEYHDVAGCHSEAAMVLHLDLDELAEEAADSMREKLQLTDEEWNEWEEQKEGLDDKRNRLRVVLKQRFEDWAVRPMARLLGSHCPLQS